ncbi:transcription factor bHLH118-like [Olea europaea subsp. europaea]|uniref:Transcription factor bHLH118-like n=1 Tax=Olea europaea subsp. europaea TaxID=158383 RepID=A0A8S0PAB4_OLEEU|nr:transcription factor bHLH118-like [Olea europaea subsp. europaea]
MFPLQSGDDLAFQPPSVIKRDQILQDLTMNHTLVENSNHSTSRWEKGEQRSSGIQENKDGSTSDGSYIRKLMHRDLERQRRQEMANLYASLRSIVPVEYLKVTLATRMEAPLVFRIVTVNPCRDGAEILIGSSLKEEGIPLSRVLVELLERGLNVVSYVSTKANEMSLHIIQCEASDIRCNDLSELTGRLTEVIDLRRDNS